MPKTLAKIVAAIRDHPVSSSGLVLIVSLAILSVPFRRQFVVNTTPSLPRGIYVCTGEPPAVGRIVEFRVPDAVRDNLAGGVDHIIKPVVAGPGDEVDTIDGVVHVNGRAIAASTVTATHTKA